MKALIVVGHSDYNIQIPLAEYTAYEMKNRGYDISFLNTMATNDANVLKSQMQREAPDYIITFDGAGFDLDMLGEDLFYNSLCCPAIHVLTDRAYMYDECLKQRMNFTMKFAVMGEEDCRYIKNMYKGVNCFKAPFPHNIHSDYKNHKLLIAETYIPSNEVMERIKTLPPAFVNLCENVIFDYNKDGREPVDFVTDYFNSQGVEISKTELAEIMPVINLPLEYIHMKRIEEMIPVMEAEAEKIFVAGKGWDGYKGNVTRIGDDQIQAKDLMEHMYDKVLYSFGIKGKERINLTDVLAYYNKTPVFKDELLR